MKILIVEPDEYYHSQFRDHISEVAELQFAHGAEAALRIVDAEPFDLLITELIFDDGHAYDLLPRFQGIPFVVYTKVNHLEDIEQSLNLGASGYFVKGKDTVNDIKQLVLSLDS